MPVAKTFGIMLGDRIDFTAPCKYLKEERIVSSINCLRAGSIVRTTEQEPRAWTQDDKLGYVI